MKIIIIGATGTIGAAIARSEESYYEKTTNSSNCHHIYDSFVIWTPIMLK